MRQLPTAGRQIMFITFEGPEGSGKTSQIKALAEYLRQTGYEVITTREPGGTPIGDQVRSVLTRLDNTAMHPRTEILLFLAARAQLVEELVRPETAAGRLVLCDRYADSTLAYQGYGHGYDLDLLRGLLNFATGGLWPDLTVLLDVEPGLGLARKKSSEEWNRLDAYALAFHQRVRQGFLEMAAAEPGRWSTVDACQAPDQVQADIRRVVLAKLEPR
jgi:dTMP kinase